MSKTYSKKQISKLAANWWTELLAVNMWQMEWERKHADYIVVVPDPLNSWYISTFNRVLKAEIMSYLECEGDKNWNEPRCAWKFERRISISLRGICRQIQCSCDCIGIDAESYLPWAILILSREGVKGSWYFNKPPWSITTGLLP